MAAVAAWAAESAAGVTVAVRAKPRSSRPGAGPAAPGDRELVVRVRSAPVDGKANRELIEVAADAFGLPRRAVTLVGGETSKTKRLLLAGVSLAEAVARIPTVG